MNHRVDVPALLDGVVYAESAFNSAATVGRRLAVQPDPVRATRRGGAPRRARRPRRAADRPRRRVLPARTRGPGRPSPGAGTPRVRSRYARATRGARTAGVPFVRGVVLTGSAAAGSAGKKADADLLVIVARGRIATVFLLLGSLSRLTGRRLSARTSTWQRTGCRSWKVTSTSPAKWRRRCRSQGRRRICAAPIRGSSASFPTWRSLTFGSPRRSRPRRGCSNSCSAGGSATGWSSAPMTSPPGDSRPIMRGSGKPHHRRISPL